MSDRNFQVTFGAGRVCVRSRHKHSDAVHEGPARLTVGDHSVLALQFADVVAQIKVKMAVEILNFVTKVSQFPLQGDPLRA